MPLYVRLIRPVARQRRKLQAWNIASLTARSQMQLKANAPAPLGLVGKTQMQLQMRAPVPQGFVGISKMQLQMRAPAPQGFVGRVQIQVKMNAPAPAGLIGKVQAQLKANAPAPAGFIGKTQAQVKANAPAPLGLVGKVQWQVKANAITPVGLVGRSQMQVKATPNYSFGVGNVNQVVIDDVYGNDAITRINMPMVPQVATHAVPCIIYISAGKLLTKFDVLSLVFTRPDGTTFTRNTNINIGAVNFFTGIPTGGGRLVPGTYVWYILDGPSMTQTGNWGVQLLVNQALSVEGFFNVQ